jgi:basic membrane protein A and related proteins
MYRTIPRMKLSLTLAPLLLATPLALAQTAPATQVAATQVAAKSSTAPLTIGLAFGFGGKYDHSFNQSALEGAQRAVRELGVTLQQFEPKTDAKGVTAWGAEPLAKAGAGLVIGVGFSNKDDIEKTSVNHPATKFALIDDLPSGANTVGLRFREQEGAFLVGYIAAQSTSTGVVGFVGGQDVPVIHKFQAGFTAGVRFICPSCKVLAAYTGTTPKAWNDPQKAAQLTAGMQKQGADVIFAAAGASGAGVIAKINHTQCLKAVALPTEVKFVKNPFASIPRSAAYAKACSGDTRPTFFIGVDSNQNDLGDDDKNPDTLNHGLTSMVKRVDNAVYSIIRDVQKGKPWRLGEQSFGLQNDGVGYAIDKYNRALINPALESRLKKVQGLIVSGTVRVPSK